MSRTFVTFSVDDIPTFKNKMLSWVNRFNIFCLLDNHNYKLPYHSQECILAAGAVKSFTTEENFFESLQNFSSETNDWIFGHFSYDLKNKIEELQSNNIDHIDFPDAFLFAPEIIIKISVDEISIGAFGDVKKIFEEICSTNTTPQTLPDIKFTPRISKVEYIEIVEQLRQHIKRGDCYEINFCQEFFAENTAVDPELLYQKLTLVSPNPFSAFYRLHDKYLVCSSPERYLKKIGDTIISQPIKGTGRRDLHDEEKDLQSRHQLETSAKDRSENVMIVDLVRNDLSKVCTEGSVTVDHLYEVQTFPYVHQMVSTIVGELKPGLGISEILQATFPMGSMTGAPKKKVMELIERFEQTKRGIYSGTVGYITPEKDFDFNVVIRSLVYNSSSQYLSYQVGGAITYNSSANDEYEECLTKAEAIKKAL